MAEGAIDLARRAENHQPSTIAQIIWENARRAGRDPCIVSVDGGLLTWRDLLEQLEHTSRALRASGIGPDDRVAVVLPNGPTLATAFLSIASCSACAPLNPAYGADEFEWSFRDLGAVALVTVRDGAGQAANAADRLGIPIIELVPDPSAPGRFELGGRQWRRGSIGTVVTPQSVALLLHTSGTTSRAKLVPLRHANLLASSRNMVAALELSAEDRCLNLMPLFHIHGLVGGLLAPLSAGGSAVCAPNFRPDAFFQWLSDTQPTWLTAVPTMHSAIVADAPRHREAIERCRLRFIRSSSAPMPVKLFGELSRTFRVPVLEAYSMTEAAHQITINPLPPGRQKPGTVGRPAGPEVAVIDETGNAVPSGQTGEVAIRGPSVTSGYDANPSANAEAFIGDWLRTGDLGHFDTDGYLVLSGRLKEQVNRGGEKISPIEIDQALLKHPDVVEAVAFGVPHPSLGEDVAAAVVLGQQSEIGSRELQAHLKGQLSGFKVPRRIFLVDRIPKGPTGKVQRRLLREHFAAAAVPDSAEDRNAEEGMSDLERRLLDLWRDMLRPARVGLDDDFFDSGGDSLRALQMLLEVEKIVGRAVPETILHECSTVRQMAHLLTVDDLSNRAPLIRVKTTGSLPPFFFFHGDFSGGYYTRRLAGMLDQDQPFISVMPHGLAQEPMPSSIEEMAAERLPLILETQPDGRFRLGGYCNGGLVALEVARLLLNAGRSVDLVVMVDPPILNVRPSSKAIYGTIDRALRALDAQWELSHPRLTRAIDVCWRRHNDLERLSRETLWRYAAGAYRKLRGRTPDLRERTLGSAQERAGQRLGARLFGRELSDRERKFHDNYTRLYRHYFPAPIDAPVVYYSAGYRPGALRHFGGTVEFNWIPGGHWGCVSTNLDVLGSQLRRRLLDA
jgi:oxalate---CoA ligase